MLFLFAIPSLPRLQIIVLPSHIISLRLVSTLVWRHLQTNVCGGLKESGRGSKSCPYEKRKISQTPLSAPLGRSLDHRRGPFTDAISRAVDSTLVVRFRRAVDTVLLLSRRALPGEPIDSQRIASRQPATRNPQEQNHPCFLQSARLIESLRSSRMNLAVGFISGAFSQRTARQV
jgi:hypothetical protein